MGMSASQVRLLTVTKRIHEVENEAQRVQNQKMLLGLESDEAYEEYLAAMEKQNIEQAIFNPNTGTFEWEVADIQSMLAAGYRFTIPDPIYNLTKEDTVVNQQVTLDTSTREIKFGSTATGYYSDATSLGTGIPLYYDAACTQYAGTLADITQGTSTTKAKIAVNVGHNDQYGVAQLSSWSQIKAAFGITDDNLQTNPNLLRELVYNAKMLILSKQLQDDGVTYNWEETNVATNVGLRENEDDSRIARAEADYEAALRRIDKKEEKYDADLAKMDQERSALTTQLDTFKTCIKDNIDRTFKVFS